MAQMATDPKVLFIRNMPAQLSPPDKTEFLKLFGAFNVTIIGQNSARAEFNSEENAKEAMTRMHQLDILGSRLIVKYGKRINIVRSNGNDDDLERPNSTKMSDFLNRILAINSDLNFDQPPPHHLKYKYPRVTTAIIHKIGLALRENSKFYYQVLHLMNRMNLPPPFPEFNEINPYQRDVSSQTEGFKIQKPDLATDESELESDEEEFCFKNKKRKIEFKNKPEKIKALLQKPKSSLATTESPLPQLVTKSIEIVLPEKLPEPIENLNPESEPKNEEISNENSTLDDLKQNCVPWDQLKEMPIFQKYDKGIPSDVLYIKNLAKTVAEEDLHKIFDRYQKNPGDIMIDLKTQGKLRGQAWLTFNIPYESIEDEDCQVGHRQIDKALKETNGYILKDKIMYVCYAKAKKS